MRQKSPYLIVFAVFILVGFTSFQAQAGILEFLFPSLRDKGPTPSETLQAPFATPPAGAEESGTETGARLLPENAIPLNLPHRSTQEISTWLVTVASESLTFEDENHKKNLEAMAVYFNEGGHQQYMGFLQDKNIVQGNSILNILDTGKFRIRSFVQELPLLLNEGAVGGRYRWLYEVPMMVSYMPPGMTDYKKVRPFNQKVKLTIQVGRSSKKIGGTNVQIERWIARAEELSKK